jgi:hypothetical protein
MATKPAIMKLKKNNMTKLVTRTFVTLASVMQGSGGPTEDTSGAFTYGKWLVPYCDDILGKTMAEHSAGHLVSY